MEILSLDSKHPTKLIAALLDKVPKSSILRRNISLEGHLLLLDGPKGILEVGMVSRGWLRERNKSDLTKMRGWMMGYRSNNLIIIRYPIKVSPVK